MTANIHWKFDNKWDKNAEIQKTKKEKEKKKKNTKSGFTCFFMSPSKYTSGRSSTSINDKTLFNFTIPNPENWLGPWQAKKDNLGI